MTDEELAREAHASLYAADPDDIYDKVLLLIRRIRADEREQCARVCDGLAADLGNATHEVMGKNSDGLAEN